MLTCAEVLFIAIAFVLGYVFGKMSHIDIRLSLGKLLKGGGAPALGAAAVSGGVKVNDVVMYRFTFQPGHYGLPTGTEGVAFGTVKRINKSGTINVRWHMFYAPYLSPPFIQRRFLESDKGYINFGDEYHNGVVCPSFKRDPTGMVVMRYAAQENTDMNWGDDVATQPNVECEEEAACITGLYPTGTSVYNEKTLVNAIKKPPITKQTTVDGATVITCGPVSYSSCSITYLADDYVYVYHDPVGETKNKIKCKKVRIYAKGASDNINGNYIHLAQIEVWSGGVNVATSAHSAATQKSTLDNLPASNTIDGDLNTFNHTDVNSWYELTFDKEYLVDKIVLYNRRDCCFERLKNNYMDVYDGAGKKGVRVDLAQLFADNNYVATYTAMKQVSKAAGYQNQTAAKLPNLKRGDRIVFNIVNATGPHGIKAVINQNNWTFQLTERNTASPDAAVISYAYPANLVGATAGITINKSMDWMTYSIIHTVF